MFSGVFSVWARLFLYMLGHLCAHVFLCVLVQLYACVFLCILLHLYAHVFLCILGHLCACMLLWVMVYFSCVYWCTCVHMCFCVHRYTCVHVCLEARELAWWLGLRYQPSFFPLKVESLFGLQLASRALFAWNPQGSTCLCLFGARITSSCHLFQCQLLPLPPGPLLERHAFSCVNPLPYHLLLWNHCDHDFVFCQNKTKMVRLFPKVWTFLQYFSELQLLRSLLQKLTHF